jgi:SET domain-containing protein
MKKLSVPAGVSQHSPCYKVRPSPVHGYGVFAIRDIRKGETVGEYVGERITHGEANRRYGEKHEHDGHTLLFTVSSRVVIDGSVGGNDTRFINHSCAPNCEARIVRGRVFIVARKGIRNGEEIYLEYSIAREDDDPPNVDEIYACRCASARCRGTMLWPARRP